MTRCLDAIEDLEQRTGELDDAIHEAFVRSPEAQLLRTIPGIGELTAVALVAFVCPIERFASSEKLCSYAGLSPTTYQSADHLYHGKLKWDCNTFLRGLLIEASWTHRQQSKTGEVSKVARRIGRRRGKMKGTVAGAHKLLKIVYAVLKRKTPYLPHAPERTAPTQSLRDLRAAASAKNGASRSGALGCG